MNKVAIVIFGRKHSGKSTLANYLRDTYGARVESFADTIKRIVMGAFDMTHDQVYTEVGKDTIDPRYGVTPRWILQRIGTEGVQPVLGRDFWAQIAGRTIRENAEMLWTIDDGRFTHEVTAIASNLRQVHGDAYFIRVTCTSTPPATPETHASEQVDNLPATLFDRTILWSREGAGDQRPRILAAFVPVFEGLMKAHEPLRTTVGFMERHRSMAKHLEKG